MHRRLENELGLVDFRKLQSKRRSSCQTPEPVVASDQPDFHLLGRCFRLVGEVRP
jgi:hypothetical protein